METAGIELVRQREQKFQMYLQGKVHTKDLCGWSKVKEGNVGSWTVTGDHVSWASLRNLGSIPSVVEGH